MEKILKKYQISLPYHRGANYQERSNLVKQDFIVVVNKIVELGGTIETDKHFDFGYMYNHFNAMIKPEDLSKIDSLKQVEGIREV